MLRPAPPNPTPVIVPASQSGIYIAPHAYSSVWLLDCFPHRLTPTETARPTHAFTAWLASGSR
jgi:hypothetical protein